VRAQHRSREFCELLDLLDTQTPADEVIHLIVDPVSLHRSVEVAAWLANRPERTFKFHFLAIRSSWLSFIEAWFSILSRKCLKRANFPNSNVATQAIDDFMDVQHSPRASLLVEERGPLLPTSERQVELSAQRLLLLRDSGKHHPDACRPHGVNANTTPG